MAANGDADGIWMVGVAQPAHPAAAKPGYTGTMMTPLEQEVVANTISGGLNRLPMVIDHADFKPGVHGQSIPPEKIIGYAVEAWRDPELGLMVMAHIPADKPDAGKFVRDIMDRGRMKVDPPPPHSSH